MLVVNSQLDDTDSPELPFTVSRVTLPDEAELGSAPSGAEAHRRGDLAGDPFVQRPPVPVR